MGGLMLFFIIVLWVIAVKKLTTFFSKWIPTSKFSPALKVLLFVLLLVMPFMDEIIGGKIFYSECEKLPPVKFQGAASIGAGYFFDIEGNPKWHSDIEFEAMTSGDNGEYFRSEVKLLASKQTIRKFPINIELEKTQYFGGDAHSLIFETTSLRSNGGWIRNWMSGLFGTYSCRSSGEWPKEQYWIKF